ncbi:hypothetical protein R69608_03220 [Paraburkholderia nemoris]|uniref:hypothetical protein n=1 Tax=Paraburkholderia nemoris TaxID=2793076 RepID=UPI001912DD61|nr:hypothetical protein [Paraburkholderia nemoris]MBK5148545.1 hypothetical protein [Burkholderia sp. R-69608]CAE6906135.1 hypothetical protein R69608_03220 [Paraburkholderia nemoris]
MNTSTKILAMLLLGIGPLVAHAQSSQEAAPSRVENGTGTLVTGTGNLKLSPVSAAQEGTGYVIDSSGYGESVAEYSMSGRRVEVTSSSYSPPIYRVR